MLMVKSVGHVGLKESFLCYSSNVPMRNILVKLGSKGLLLSTVISLIFVPFKLRISQKGSLIGISAQL